MKIEGAEVVETIEDAIDKAKTYEDNEIFVIGGEAIYRLALPFVDRIYLTKVHAKVEGDRYFKFSESDFEEVSRQSHQPGEQDQFAYDFLVLERL